MIKLEKSNPKLSFLSMQNWKMSISFMKRTYWKVQLLVIATLLIVSTSYAQVQRTDSISGQSLLAKPDKKELRYNLSEDGNHYVKLTFLNQTWVRYNESNPGTNVYGDAKSSTFDIGLRRTRMQLYGQLSDKVFFYMQFGQNNFNYLSQRKVGAFFHDATAEYAVVKNKLSLGAGLNAWSGPSRYASPSVGSILGVDAPIFAQATNDVTDEFLRKLSVYAKGKLGKLDYRIAIATPMAVQNASAPNSSVLVNTYSNFSIKAPKPQYQGYFSYQFLDQESNLLPYQTGTYLGSKRVFTVGAGFVVQQDAMYHKAENTPSSDTIYSNLNLFAVDVFYDAPLNKEKGTALTAYAGYFSNDYGPNYIRSNGVMNPGQGGNTLSGAGNAFPMYGTGNVLFGQVGYLMHKNLLGENNGTLQPYASLMYANYKRLADPMVVYDLGINWLIRAHNSKISFNYQSRPVFSTNTAGELAQSQRKGMYALQYQILI